MLLVDAAHECSSRRQDLIDEDEDGLFRAELDALADDVDELAYGEVGGHEVFLLVDGRDVALLYFLADYLSLLRQHVARHNKSGWMEAGSEDAASVMEGRGIGIRTGMRSAYF